MNDPTLSLRQQLAADLVSKRAIRSPEWRRAFERVPRHLFVPRFHLEYEDRTLDSSVPQQYDEWLATVYSDQGLITQYGEDGYSSSSSSTPSTMAPMLEVLAARPGNRVLEIGTGSGYNAALLCERLGSEAVTTIDVDPALVAVARERLGVAGYRPSVEVGDGYHGWPAGAPYDALIGTCYLWPLPPAWIEQVRPGGRVVAVVPNGLVVLTVQENGSARGPFHPDTFGFMYARGGHMPRRLPGSGIADLVADEGATRPCLYPSRITEAGRNWSFWFFWGLLITPYAKLVREKGALILVEERDHSWFRLNQTDDRVTQGGPRRLWDEIENLFETWCHLGAPNREHFGLTVEGDGQHRLWLDRPESSPAWDLVGSSLNSEAPVARSP